MLVDKVNRLLEVAQETKPQQVKQPDTIRATTLVSAMKQIDDAVADVEKAAAATKKLLEKELQQHKKLMEKLFNVLEKPTTTTTKAANKLGYKDWQIKWWLIWKAQEWEELTWEEDTLRTAAKCYSKQTWAKKKAQLIKAGILTEDNEGDLKVNVVPQKVLDLEVSK
jgi:molecular chaperone DnaK (HSP70)